MLRKKNDRFDQIAIMQPTFLPWLGYFDLMDQVDLFIFLDNVPFAKRSWQQRNRIKTPQGLEWLSVPVMVSGRSGQLISQVEIADPMFREKHLRKLTANYQQAAHFSEWFGDVQSIMEQGHRLLADLNMALITWVAQRLLAIDTPILRASELPVSGKRTGLLLSIVGQVDAKRYLSPVGSATYLAQDYDLFERAGIDLSFHTYEHPSYSQLFGTFLPNASTIDLIFNEGSQSGSVMRRGRRPPVHAELFFESHKMGDMIRADN